MRFKILIVALLVAPGCAPTAAQMQIDEAETPDKFSIGQEDWQVGCQDDQKDPYGELTEKAKCWVSVTYNGRRNEGTSMMVEKLFEVNAAKGPVLVIDGALDTDLCDETPRSKAVDGVPIHNLPMSQQINRVLSGSVYVRETDRPWPYCNVYNQVTTVQGARRAYDRMMVSWNAR